MDASNIESAPMPAVKNLLSRFESLGVDQSQTSRSVSLQALTPSSPRVPITSNTPSPGPGLRSVSSSSSLTSTSSVTTKRPPPPPPPLASRSNNKTVSPPSPTPSISPLLRPVPIPIPSVPKAGLPISTKVDVTEDDHELLREGLPPTSTVAALRNRFSNTPLIHPQSSKPPVPHHLRATPDPETPLISLTTSPDEYIPQESHFHSHSHSSSSISLSSLDDPFSEDTTESAMDDPDSSSTSVAAPPIPARRPHHHHQASSSSSVSSRVSISSDSDTSPSPGTGQSSSKMSVSSSFSSLSARLPPPPPRPRALALPLEVVDSPSPTPPPPLPVRRSTVAQAEDLASQLTTPRSRPPPPPPPHSSHPSANHLVHVTQSTSAIELLPPTSTPVLSSSDRKSFGQLPPPPTRAIALGEKLPPPPTRTIGLGDKLPPKRSTQLNVNGASGGGASNGESEEDESGDEDEFVKGSSAGIDMLPDLTRASRRPPHLFAADREYGGQPIPCKISVPAHTGHLAMSGASVVVGSGHHVRIYNTNLSLEDPVVNLDTRNFGYGGKEGGKVGKGKEGGKDWGKVGAIEFRDEFSVWVGLREGGLAEVDVRSGEVVGVKHGAHVSGVIYLFRYCKGGGGEAEMVSVDEGGKVLIWSSLDSSFSSPAQAQVNLLSQIPRMIRITDKLDFAQLIGGVLWTAGRSEQQGAGTPARTPIIRLYDLFTTPTTTTTSKPMLGKTVIPTEHVGPVTSAAVVPTNPGYVYLGHEEGYITIWENGNLVGGGGQPRCAEVMKVSTTDVTSVEGVNDKLWAGGRNGMITAYDVLPRPWIATNSWSAHPGLPVLNLSADPFGIKSHARLGVVSVGRDERVWFWDGLLSLDWVDTELDKYESTFSTFRPLKVLVVSWNCDSAKPDSLYGDTANLNFFRDVLGSVDGPDVIEFGFQEVIDLESRKMAAKGMLMGGTEGNSNSTLSLKRHRDKDREREREAGGGTMLLGLSDKVTGAYKRWYDALLMAVRLAMPPETPYTVLHTESMVGLFTCVLVKSSERGAVKDVAISTVKRGMGGRYGNKGGILSRFLIDDSSLCFVNCHLAAGQHAVRARNADAAGMLEQQSVFPSAMEPLAFVGGGDGSMVLDHEIVFFHGDMNYRIDQRRDAIAAAVLANEHESLLAHDQLLKEIKFNRGCRFRFFTEGAITFAPTYKYDRRSNEYDSSEKRRAPAWCDRVLWRSRVPSRVEQLHYQRYEVNVSDHRPISAAFRVTVKRIRHEVRQKKKAEVQMKWNELQQTLLNGAREFYVNMNLV